MLRPQEEARAEFEIICPEDFTLEDSEGPCRQGPVSWAYAFKRSTRGTVAALSRQVNRIPYRCPKTLSI